MIVIFVAGILLLTTAAQECPDSPTSIFGGACVEGCSGNSDCTNGQICCSNGCGHECMTPVADPCATVRCAAPNCSEWSAGTITPEGQCCPVCACTATDGSMVAAGTSFMNDCNTCSCLNNGAAICTLIACVSTTPPSNTTTDTTTLPTSSPVGCPDATGLIGTCDEQCSSDDGCSNGQLCCSNGCGHACMDPTINCASVTCLRPDCDPPSVLFIPSGSCCPMCAIPDTAYTPESTEVPTDNPSRTCPTLESNNENNCVTVDDDVCSSNDDCQHGRICCSNGCGGRVCSDSVGICQLVRCAWPRCEGGVQPQTSPFRCCPFCPSEESITGGTGVITMATLMMVTLCCFLTFLF